MKTIQCIFTVDKGYMTVRRAWCLQAKDAACKRTLQGTRMASRHICSLNYY